MTWLGKRRPISFDASLGPELARRKECALVAVPHDACVLRAVGVDHQISISLSQFAVRFTCDGRLVG